MDPRLGELPRPTPEQMVGKQTGKLQPKATPCPFGCTEDSPSMNEHGYCQHLVGWSADGKTYERRERIVNTSSEICRGSYAIQKTDTCVAMQSGLRVYREKGKAPVLIERPKSEVCPDEVADEETTDFEANVADIVAV